MLDIKQINSFVQKIKKTINPKHYEDLDAIRIIAEELYYYEDELPSNMPYIINLSTAEEVIGLVAEFLKEFNSGLYNSFIQIVLSQSENITMDIYNYSELTEQQKQEIDSKWNGLKYPKYGRTYSDIFERHISVPLATEMHEALKRLKLKNKVSLSDAFILLHEFIHTLDKTCTSRKWLAEIPTYCFEKIFQDWLIKRMPWRKGSIKALEVIRINNALRDAESLHIMMELLVLSEISQDGIISEKDLYKWIGKKWSDIDVAEQEISSLMSEAPDFNSTVRYTLGLIAYPHFIKIHRQDKEKGTQVIKEFISSIDEQTSVADSLEILGIDISSEGIESSIEEILGDLSEIVDDNGVIVPEK